MLKVFAPFLLLILVACSLQNEDALHRQFTQNKNTIELILEMQKQDSKLVRIAPTFTRLENDWSWPRNNIGISEERWEKYRSLFNSAGITDGVQKDGDYVWYFVSSQGLSIGGTSRGFVYVSKRPQPVVDKFDKCPPGEGICYIELKNNWYLFQWVT